MDDQALRERTHFELDLGLAALAIVAGVIGMGVYIGAMAYAIGSKAVKHPPAKTAVIPSPATPSLPRLQKEQAP